MKAKRLAAAALACGVAWVLMVGGIAIAESTPEEVMKPTCTEVVAESVEESGESPQQDCEGEESWVLKALREQEAKSAEEEKAKAEAEAQAKAEEIAQVQAELEAAAAAEEAAKQQAEQAAANAAASAASYEATSSYETAYYEPDPAYYEPEPAYTPEPTYAEEAPAPEPAPTPAQTSMTAQTIVVNGVAISYVYSYGWVPDYGAGVWKGSDSTTDGSYGYFVGHNPGSFWPAASIGIGAPITVCDCDGNSRTYYVAETFVVPVGSTWNDVCDAVYRYGESVTLQTCVDGGYRIVVAA